MERTLLAYLTVAMGLLAAVIFFGLTVFPFQYGTTKGALVAGGVVFLAYVEIVLDNSSF